MNKLLSILFIALVFNSCTQKKANFEGLIPINGTELYVKTIGAGDPIIFIHGGPGLGFDYFLPQMEKLSKNHQLIFFDQRISGRSSSEVSPDSITFDFFIEDIDALRKHFGLDRIAVLAHSWGNLLAAEYALRFPDHLEKLILSNPVPFSKEYEEEVQEIQAKEMDSLFISERQKIMSSQGFLNRELAAFEELFLLSFSLSFYDTTNMNAMNFKLFDGFLQRNEKMQYFTGLEQFDYYEKFGQIKTPTLLIRGLADLSVPEADQRAVDSLANARLVEMKFSGHFPFIEQNEEYIWEIRNFLKE